jgi:hypothetical protein
MIFKDISNFSDVNDYLPILIAVLIVDMIGIILSFTGVLKSERLRTWYKKYGLNAVIADVLVIVLGIIITRFLYKFIFKKFNILYFVGLALIVQIIHDISFYLIFSSVPPHVNSMLNFFKEYAKEIKHWAIIGDSIMIVTACFISSMLASFSLNTNIILLTFLLYLLPYVLNTFEVENKNHNLN